MERGEPAEDSTPAHRGGRRVALLAPVWLALLGVCLGALGACASPRDTTELPDDPAEALQQLGWLAGDWRRLDSSAPRGERWWFDGQELRGEAWVADGPRRLVEERLSIQIEDGALVYVPSFPDSSAESTRFELVELGRRAAAFENREHGHPWRLAYVSSPVGMLVSVFYEAEEPEGRQSGRPARRVDLRFVRAN